MTERQMIHELVVVGLRLRCLVWDAVEERGDPDASGRHIAALYDFRKLHLEAQRLFSPTIEELKQWEAEAHEKVWGPKTQKPGA